MTLWLRLSLLVVCLYGVFLGLYWRARRLLKGLPSYGQIPFFGSLHMFLGGGEVVFRRLKEISNITDNTNLPFVVWLGPRPLILLSNPDDIKAVANAFLDRPYFYNFAREWLGEGLLLVPGKIWKRNMRKVAAAFTGNMVEGFQEVFNTKAQDLVEGLKMEVGKGPFNAMPYLSFMTLRAIFQTGLGVNYPADSSKIREYHNAFSTALELMIKRGTNLLMHLDCVYQLTSDHGKFLKALKVLHTLSDGVIKEKRLSREFRKRNDDLSKDSRNKTGELRTILNVLLDLSEAGLMSESQVRSEVNTILLGGQDTVAATLHYAMLMLGCNTDVQNKLHDEVKQVFKKTSSLNKDALADLVYCEAVVNETLRLYPPIPAVTRYADRDLDLQSCKIPKGTFCSLNLWGAGRSQRAWGPDAEEYKPDRWLPPNTPNAAYMPFSAGRRACIGKRYAMALLKTVLAFCVRDLIFESEAHNLELSMDVGLRATKGYLLQVKLRN